jgi:hypothetical protein
MIHNIAALAVAHHIARWPSWIPYEIDLFLILFCFNPPIYFVRMEL